MASIRSGLGENMEDRYLFKAKHFKEWHIGNIVKEPDGLYIRDIKGNAMAYIDDESTICQCTGLKDKNDNLIWENDIVGLYNENKEERYAVGSVEYGTFNCSCCDGVYGWYFTDSADIRDSERYEVIGNIFDNAELLESEG